MELDDAYVALLEVLEAHGPLAEPELVSALRRAGLSEWEVGEVLDYPPGVVASLPDGRWVSLPSLLAPRRLTRRITAGEVALDVVVLDADLVAAAPLFDAGVGLADGSPSPVLDAEEDAGLIAERNPAAIGSLPREEVLVLPVGHLAHLGVQAGDLISLGFSSDGAVVERVEGPVPTPSELVAEITGHLGDTPVDVDELVWALCAEDPKAFTEPTAPVSELLDHAGASRYRSQVAAPGVDIAGWYRAQRLERIAATHRLRRSEAEDLLVLIEHHTLLDGIIHGLSDDLADDGDEPPGDATPGTDAAPGSPTGLASADDRDDGRSGAGTDRDGEEPGAGLDLQKARDAALAASAVLASPDAAAALLGECAGMGREGLPALGVLAETLEPNAPRRARASLRWLRAKVLERLGGVEEAEGELRAALALDPEHPLILEDLGRFASDRGDADHALRLLRRAGVPRDDSLVEVLEAHRTPAASAVGRNDPCWCGSGRKRKQCHRDGGPALPIEARSGWLVAKTADYLQQGPHRQLVLRLAMARAEPLGDGALLDALSDPFVHDVALAEAGAYRDFLAERGALLPEDERAVLEQWALVERSLYDVVEVDPDRGLRLRDVRTGDRHEVTERTASRSLRPGDLVCTRVVPVGEQLQLVGGVEPVPLHLRDTVIELLDDPDPVELVALLSARFAPPSITNTEGEDLVDCTVTIRVPDPARLADELDGRFERSDADGAPVWDETVETMGMPRQRSRIQLSEDIATVTANSHERADRTVALVLDVAPGAEVLADERTPYAELLAERAGAPEPVGAGGFALDPTDPQVEEVLRQVVSQMEEAWVDESIPALGGVTPRQAAEDPTRRDDLLRLLDSFDRFPSGPGAMDPARLRRLLDL